MAARKSSRNTSGRKYSRKASATVGSAMRRRKHGTLKTRGGRKVTSRKQALAIGINEAREKGEKTPRKRASKTSARKSASRKSASRKSAPRKSAARTSARKKSTGRKSSGRKSTARKS